MLIMNWLPIHMSGTSHCVCVSRFRKPDTALSMGIPYCFAHQMCHRAHLSAKSRLVGGLCTTRTPTRFALSCGAILLCDLSRRAARRIPSPLLRRGAPSMSARRAILKECILLVWSAATCRRFVRQRLVAALEEHRDKSRWRKAVTSHRTPHKSVSKH